MTPEQRKELALAGYYATVAVAMLDNPGWRYGQALFNVLAERRPDLSARREAASMSAEPRAAHTPGLWTVVNDGPMDGGTVPVWRVRDTGGWTVAGLIEDANHARIIAAAPELLAALKACEDLLAEFAAGGAENPELDIARAAIAKAEGRDV